MGTSGSYTGGGGAAGHDLRDEISRWLDLLPPSGDRPRPDGKPQPGGVVEPAASPPDIPRLPPETLLPAVQLFEPSRMPLRPSGRRGRGGVGAPSGGGSGGVWGRDGGRRGGGARRSTSASASTAGRAAAAAYALRTHDAATLAQLGLNYAELRSLDSFEQVRRIVDAACGPIGDGTIEDDERRHVAAQVAEWVLEQGEAGSEPDLEEVLRETIATIIFEAAATETGDLIRNGKHPPWASVEGERQLRDAARALADRARLTPGTATADDITRAIQEGIETLRYIQVAA